MSDTKKPAKTATRAKKDSYQGFTEDERAAMKDRAQELKASARRGSKVSIEEAEGEVLAKIAELPAPDRGIAERLHKLIRSTVPDLMPRLYYGMPAFAKDGKVLCFFQPASKFKSRYSMIGFSDVASLDDGTMWPTYYALTQLTAAEEARIGTLVKQAAS